MQEHSNQFKEDGYYSAYKIIRNRFRKYNPKELIHHCLLFINKPESNNVDKLRKHPWLVLLLIKWILLDGDLSRRGRKKIDNAKFIELLNMVFDIATKTRLPNQFDHHILFYRVTAYQQFIYQLKFSISRLSRQAIFFADLPDSHLIQRTFKELTGLTITSFLELSLITLIHFITKNNLSLPVSWYDSVTSEYSVMSRAIPTNSY